MERKHMNISHSDCAYHVRCCDFRLSINICFFSAISTQIYCFDLLIDICGALVEYINQKSIYFRRIFEIIHTQNDLAGYKSLRFS